MNTEKKTSKKEPKLREYYRLPLGPDGQPNGNVESVWMTLREYREAVKNKSIPYLFKNYAAALYRAQD